jgi:acyl-coenzyme A synthetase/AMP-(fatty) acid ligase
MADLPLVRNHETGAVFAYFDRRPVTLSRFLEHVSQLARALPGRRHMINLCADRYRFAVAFAAALLREQVSLLPPNMAPDLIARLEHDYPDAYCLTDTIAGSPAAETFIFPTLDEGGAAVMTVPFVPETQVAAILFTSGSTGRPLPHQKTWRSLVTGACAEAQRLSLQAGLAVLATVPPQHMFGLESTVLLPMQNGAALNGCRPFFPADIRAELEALPRPRALVTTPIHLRTLLSEPQDVPAADLLLCATAPLSPQLAALAEERFAAPLYEIYGCTEAGQIAARRTVETPEWQTLGSLSLHQDAAGTWAAGGHAEKAVLLADVIELRDARTFLLHGRTAGLVNIAGKRTSLANLDYHLNSVEGVRDGAFVMPDEADGAVARLMAFVVAPGVSGDSIMQALRQRIDAVFLPRPLYLVESLPRDSTGKLPRSALDYLRIGLARKAG